MNVIISQSVYKINVINKKKSINIYVSQNKHQIASMYNIEDEEEEETKVDYDNMPDKIEIPAPLPLVRQARVIREGDWSHRIVLPLPSELRTISDLGLDIPDFNIDLVPTIPRRPRRNAFVFEQPFTTPIDDLETYRPRRNAITYDERTEEKE
jgi:hypothetical protein